MSLYNCHKQQPQPWMSYISPAMITFNGDCCSPLITNLTGLLPFQIISAGDYVGAEIRPYGGVWVPVTLTIDTILTEGFFIHSFAGGATDYTLECGMYEFRVTAGEIWWFEPFTVVDFTLTTNAFTFHDDIMTPLKFSEQQLTGVPVIAPCDSFLPFMFRTANASTAPTYFLVNEAGTETALTITVDVSVIDGRTYYIHDGACFYPFLECGTYRLKIVDGAFTYWSVEFNAVCDMNDIPDGYRAMVDFNGCVLRDEDGDILYEECSNIDDPIPPIEIMSYGLLYNNYAVNDARNICADGWHIPTMDEWQDFGVLLGCTIIGTYYFDAPNSVSSQLKEIGTDYWGGLGNTDATNSKKFNARGSAYRNPDGSFAVSRSSCQIWSLGTLYSPGAVYYYIAMSRASSWLTSALAGDRNYGIAIRPVKDFTALAEGEEGVYVGNDGKAYRTIVIEGKEYTGDNIAETKYRNGDDIPEVTDNGAWAALETGALCAYNNDWNNV